MVEVTGKGRACIPEGLTKALYQLNKVCLKRRKIPDCMDLDSLEPAAIQFMLNAYR